MRPVYLFTSFILFFVLVSCSKDDVLDPLGLSPGTLSTKVDGTLRNAESAIVLTLPDEDTGHYIVSVTAFFQPPGTTSDDEVTDAFHIHMNLTESQFKNPKGVYDLMAIHADGQLVAYALYQVGLGTEDNYQVYGMIDHEKTVGKVTITDYKIGNDVTFIPGLPASTGYTRLQGTFEMELMGATSNEQSKIVKLTEGKFNARNQLGL